MRDDRVCLMPGRYRELSLVAKVIAASRALYVHELVLEKIGNHTWREVTYNGMTNGSSDRMDDNFLEQNLSLWFYPRTGTLNTSVAG